jgi:hypothetical protein
LSADFLKTIYSPTESPAPQPVSPPANRTSFPITAIVAGAVGGAIFITILVGCIIIVRQRQQRLEVLKVSDQQRTSIIQSFDNPTWPSLTFKSELDAAETQQMSPELDVGQFRFSSLASRLASQQDQICELPARESVGSELFGSPVNNRQTTWPIDWQIQKNRTSISKEKTPRRKPLKTLGNP